MYDIVIIGGGPAGLTAANNTAHRGLKTLLLEARPHCGGQPLYYFPTKVILDHPGFPSGVTGEELSERLYQQAASSGAEIKVNEPAIDLKQCKDFFVVKTSKGQYHAKRILICTGMLNIPKKIELLSHCTNDEVVHVVKEQRRFKGKRVLVIGGGDTAIDNAIMAADYAKSVTVIVKEYMLKAKEFSAKLARKKKVKILLNTELLDIVRKKDKLTKVVVYNRKKKKSRIISIDSVVVSIGFVTAKNALNKWGLHMHRDGNLIVNHKMETNIPGVFAAGDVNGEVKLIAVACSEGIIAAINMFDDIKKPFWIEKNK